MCMSAYLSLSPAYDYPASLISSHAVRNRALSEAEDGTRVWHLFKQHDTEDPKRSPFMNKKMITEVYLPRMLSTKVSRNSPETRKHRRDLEGKAI